jgi:hypothetical protein
MTSARSAARVLVVALAALVLLHRVGSGPLATPPLSSWSALDAWYAQSDPAAAVLALVRLIAMAASGWLAVAAGLQVLVPVVERDAFRVVVDAFSPRFLRALSTSAAGLSLSAGLTLPARLAPPPHNPPGTAVMVPIDLPAPTPTELDTTSTTSLEGTSTIAPATTSTTRLDATTTTGPATAAHVTAAPAPEPVPAPGAPEEVVVTPGDSFWSIAVAEVGDRDVVPYWRALIEANRLRLVDPSNPDLLYPGQVLRLP